MLVRFASFALDSEQRRLTRDGQVVHLTAKAFDLLTLLIAAAPRIARKNELHERLWPGTFVSDATLVGLVKEVRRALSDRDRAAPIVRTAFGVGYAMAVPIERGASQAPAVARWVSTGGRRIALRDGENLIGRDPSAAIHLDVAGVSRRHARILVRDREAILEDLGSKNGTAVRDQLVSRGVVLQDGDPIEIGPVVVVYRSAASGLSTDTSPGPRAR